MNFHSDSYIRDGLFAHLDEALKYFDSDRIIGIFIQGSQNYGLDYEGSDIDTKLIVAPTFKDIAFNGRPISTTHIRDNEEHIDFKDIRLYIETFRSQNLNFLEILFTKYRYVNKIYADEWDKLVANREAITHYNPYRAIKSMKGIAMEKYHAMEHPYPSKAAVLEKYGYDPKQLHHLLRVENYIGRYIAGEPYESCLNPSNADYLVEVKRGCYDLETARIIGKAAIDNVERIADDFITKVENKGDAAVDEILNEVQYNIMKKAIELEFRNGN